MLTLPAGASLVHAFTTVRRFGVKGLIALAASALLLAGCGGGGAEAGASSSGGSSGTSGSAGSSGSSASTTPAPSISIVQTPINVSGQTGNPAPASVSIPFTIANASMATPLYGVATTSGDYVARASLSNQSAVAGTLTITFIAPALLGAGNYSETVTLNMCSDNACTHQISGAPANITVNYSVTGSALPSVSFNLVTPDAFFATTTSVTTSETTTFTIYFDNVPPAGLYLILRQPQGGFITNLTDSQAQDTAGNTIVTLNFTLASPASLGSGYFKSSVTLEACYDSACNNSVAGSPITVPINYEISLTQGMEYSLASSTLGGVSDLAYDSANQQLYVTSRSGYPPGSQAAVSQIDPISGNVVSKSMINDDLTNIAVSDDGQLLYAGSAANAVVYRLTLPGLQPDITIPLGSVTEPPANVVPNVAAQLAVAPSAAHTLAVSLVPSENSTEPPGILMFDDAIERAQSIPQLGRFASADALAWGPTANILYASRFAYQGPLAQEIDVLQADPSGLSIQSDFDLTGGTDTFGAIRYDSGKLYEASGIVRDATSGAVLGQIALPDYMPTEPSPEILCVTPDSANSRLFALVHDYQSSRLLLFVYSLPSLAPQAYIDLGYDSFDVNITPRMILWGSNGIAFNEGLQILSGTFQAEGNAGLQATTQLKQSTNARARSLPTIRVAPRGGQSH
jgi:hypothetical protein